MKSLDTHLVANKWGPKGYHQDSTQSPKMMDPGGTHGSKEVANEELLAIWIRKQTHVAKKTLLND